MKARLEGTLDGTFHGKRPDPYTVHCPRRALPAPCTSLTSGSLLTPAVRVWVSQASSSG